MKIWLHEISVTMGISVFVLHRVCLDARALLAVMDFAEFQGCLVLQDLVVVPVSRGDLDQTGRQAVTVQKVLLEMMVIVAMLAHLVQREG